jgi:sugar O-acyltransferase (sialic acid O-acetyltransferase NeuD family)
MVIIGAKGFAKELLAVFEWNGDTRDLLFFDNVNSDTPDYLYGRFPVLKTWEALQEHFLKHSPDFVLGTGGTATRMRLAEKAVYMGGRLCSIISNQALVGGFGNNIGKGVCVLAYATIGCDVNLGEGTLVNKAVTVSHDAKIGRYCIISPGARILGRTTIGDNTVIGANAVILADIKVGSNCIVGAGAVVVKDVPDNLTVVGVPAKPIIRHLPTTGTALRFKQPKADDMRLLRA